MASWAGGEEQAAQARLRRLARAHDDLLARTVKHILTGQEDGHITPAQAADFAAEAQEGRDAAVKLLDQIWPGTGR